MWHLDTLRSLAEWWISNLEVAWIEELKVGIEHLSPEDRAAALEIIDEALWVANDTTRPALVDLRASISGITESGRNEVTPEWWRNTSSWTPEEEVETWETISQWLSLISSKVTEVWTTREDVLALALEQISNPLTAENIEQWQKDHGIDDDGRIGKETYGEMYASVLDTKIRRERNQTWWIPSETQQEVLSLLEYANIGWGNVKLLLLYIGNIRWTLETQASFEENYGEFYSVIWDKIQAFEESDEWQAAIQTMDEELSRPDTDGRSMYRRIKDGIDNDNLWEEISSLIEDKWTMALFLIAWAFVFGMIPKVNNTTATNTWWKRLLIWGVLLWNSENITDITSDLVEWGGNRLDWTDSDASPTERVTEAQRREWSSLREAFPSNDTFDSIPEYFASDEAILALNPLDFPRYAEAPTYLEAMYEGRREWDRTFADLLDLSETQILSATYGVAFSAFTIAATLGTSSLWLPVIFAAGAWASIYSFFNPEDINIMNTITDEWLQSSIRDILGSEDNTDTKVLALKSLITQNSEYESQLLQLTDLVISAEIKSSSIALEALSDEKIAPMIDDITQRISYIESNITDEALRLELVGLLRDRIASVSEELEIRETEAIRTDVTDIEWDIQAQRWNINRYERDKADLVQQRTTADARRIAEIDAEIAEIDVKIAEAEWIIASLGPALIEAQRVLGNFEVEQAWAVLDSHIHYFENLLAEAISSYWIIDATQRNIQGIKQIQDSLDKIDLDITPADDSAEKTEVERKIAQVRASIASTWVAYGSELWLTEVDAASIEAANLDFLDPTTLDGIRQAISEWWVDLSTTETLEFFEISFQTNDEIIELYKWEFERQLAQNKSEIEATPIEQVYVLRQKVEARDLMKQWYLDIFGIAYEDSDIATILTAKRDELDDVLFDSIQIWESDTWAEVMRNFYNALVDPDKTFIESSLENIRLVDLILSLRDLSWDRPIPYQDANGDDQEVSDESKVVTTALLAWIEGEINFLT